MKRLGLVLALAAAFCSTPAFAQKGGVIPLCRTGCGGGGGRAAVLIVGNTFTPATRAPQSGPYTYTITVENAGDTTGTFTVSCTSQAQLPCVTPNPSSFTLDPGGEQVVTVGYSTLGLGHFSQSHGVSVTSGGGVQAPTGGPLVPTADTVLTVWRA